MAPTPAMSARAGSRSRPREGGRQSRWTLRRASEADWRTLVAHRHGMWADIGSRPARQMTEHDRVYRKWIVPRLRSGEVLVLLIESPTGLPVSSCGIWFRPEQPRPGAPRTTAPYLFSMYTAPEYRRRGLARRLVREALRICRGRGYRRVALHAAPKGRRLYRGLGFERTWEMRLVWHR